eukprot:2311913-Rhodomonas_salina.2
MTLTQICTAKSNARNRNFSTIGTSNAVSCVEIRGVQANTVSRFTGSQLEAVTGPAFVTVVTVRVCPGSFSGGGGCHQVRVRVHQVRVRVHQ